jgi:hypothetical protein
MCCVCCSLPACSPWCMLLTQSWCPSKCMGGSGPGGKKHPAVMRLDSRAMYTPPTANHDSSSTKLPPQCQPSKCSLGHKPVGGKPQRMLAS